MAFFIWTFLELSKIDIKHYKPAIIESSSGEISPNALLLCSHFFSIGLRFGYENVMINDNDLTMCSNVLF